MVERILLESIMKAVIGSDGVQNLFFETIRRLRQFPPPPSRQGSTLSSRGELPGPSDGVMHLKQPAAKPPKVEADDENVPTVRTMRFATDRPLADLSFDKKPYIVLAWRNAYGPAVDQTNVTHLRHIVTYAEIYLSRGGRTLTLNQQTSKAEISLSRGLPSIQAYALPSRTVDWGLSVSDYIAHLRVLDSVM